MTYKAIQVGTGGFGGAWCKNFLPPNVEDGLVEVVAAVDADPQALQNARQGLGLRQDQCYTNIQKAFDENRADFCTVVVPPAFHESVMDAALEHDLHVLSEPKWANAWLIEKFAHWLDGREPMETNVEDNLQSVALIFAAIESSGSGQPVRVQELLEEARNKDR